MKKVHLYIFSLFLLMFFCVNVDGVLAKQDEFGGGVGTSYSYGTVCSYSGERKTVVTGSGNTGGVVNGQIFPYVYTLKVTCSDEKCNKLSVDSYGIVKDLDGKNEVISISNSNELSTMVNSNSDFFGFKKGKGVSKCPNKVGFEQGNVNINGSGVEKFERFILNENYTQASLEQHQKFSSSREKDIDIKTITGDLISNKKRKSYSTGVNGSESGTTTQENKRQNGTNLDFVPNIMNAIDNLGKEDYGISSNGTVTCRALLGPENIELIHSILFFMSVIGTVLVIVLGITDFIKAISSNDDDALAQAFKRVKSRIISVVILLLLPVLVNFVLGLVNDNIHFEVVNDKGKVIEDVSIKIGKASDCD